MPHTFYGLPIQTQGPLFISPRYRDTKDPCAVYDGTQWHLYGSGGSSITEVWHILHATAPYKTGPWTELEPANLQGLFGPHVAAPAVVFDIAENIFHMFIQEDFLALEGGVKHLISTDGHNFNVIDTPLFPIPDTEEAGLYDPHAAEVFGEKYITYSGTNEVGKPDLYIAQSISNTWNGPWKRLGKILAHEQVPFHNPRGHAHYEWGLEGSQIIELPNKTVLLIAVCFLTEGAAGTRQRIFLSVAREPSGPYIPLAPILDPATHDWHSGENGHAAGLMEGECLYVFYQGRTQPEQNTRTEWRYGLATINLNDLMPLIDQVLNKNTPWN